MQLCTRHDNTVVRQPSPAPPPPPLRGTSVPVTHCQLVKYPPVNASTVLQRGRYSKTIANHTPTSCRQQRTCQHYAPPPPPQRFVQAKSTWSVKTRRASSWHHRDARVYALETNANHTINTPPARPLTVTIVPSTNCLRGHNAPTTQISGVILRYLIRGSSELPALEPSPPPPPPLPPP